MHLTSDIVGIFLYNNVVITFQMIYFPIYFYYEQSADSRTIDVEKYIHAEKKKLKMYVMINGVVLYIIVLSQLCTDN